MSHTEPSLIPDVQSHPDARQLAIDRVGIRDLRYPLSFVDGEGPVQRIVARCSVFVALAAERKGTHMSRLVAAIDEFSDPLSLVKLPALVDLVSAKVDSDHARVELTFPWFLRKAAPVSGAPSVMDYDVKLSAEHAGASRKLEVGIVVPVMSLCPSSKAIADYGAHNQRSHLTLTVRLRPGALLTLRELIVLAESEGSCELYGLLKRADEKYVTERAYDRPRFVEDLVRGLAARLMRDERLDGFSVEAENFESIHNHSAYARIARGMES